MIKVNKYTIQKCDYAKVNKYTIHKCDRSYTVGASAHNNVHTFYFRLDGTRIDDVSLANSLSSNNTFRDLRCVAIFSYTQNSITTFCQFLCDPSLLKGYGIFFQGGGHI